MLDVPLAPEPAAPPVAVVHWVAPFLSQSDGMGAFCARVFDPSLENVGLLQSAMFTVVEPTPGMRYTWSRPA